MEDKIRCERCKSRFDANIKYCPVCGEMVDIPKERRAEKNEKISRKQYFSEICSRRTKVNLYTVVGCVIASIVIIFAFYGYGAYNVIREINEYGAEWLDKETMWYPLIFALCSLLTGGVVIWIKDITVSIFFMLSSLLCLMESMNTIPFFRTKGLAEVITPSVMLAFAFFLIFIVATVIVVNVDYYKYLNRNPAADKYNS